MNSVLCWIIEVVNSEEWERVVFSLAEQKVICIVLRCVSFKSGVVLSPSFLYLLRPQIFQKPLSLSDWTQFGGGFRWRWRRRRLHRGSLRSKASRRSAASSSSRFRILRPPIRLRFGNTFSATRTFRTSTITSPSSSPVPRYSFANLRFTFLLLYCSLCAVETRRFMCALRASMCKSEDRHALFWFDWVCVMRSSCRSLFVLDLIVLSEIYCTWWRWCSGEFYSLFFSFLSVTVLL